MDFGLNCMDISYPPYTNLSRGRCLTHIDTEGLVIGAVIIKHKLCLSDEETVQQIQENPYLQFFVGFSSYQLAPPFAPSLFVEIRKRMGQTVFEDFHEAIICTIAKKKPAEKPGKDRRHPPAQTILPLVVAMQNLLLRKTPQVNRPKQSKWLPTGAS